MVPKEEKYGVDIGLKALIIYQPSKHNTTYNMVMAAVDVFVKNGYEVTVNYPNNTDLSYQKVICDKNMEIQEIQVYDINDMVKIVKDNDSHNGEIGKICNIKD